MYVEDLRLSFIPLIAHDVQLDRYFFSGIDFDEKGWNARSMDDKCRPRLLSIPSSSLLRRILIELG